MRIFQLIGVFLLLVSFLAIGAIVDVSFVDATYPGYNGKILIQSNRDGNNELYVVEGDGSNPINVTNNSASDISGRWSPDGRQILYTSNRDGNNEIYSMNADGSSVERITNNPSSDISFGWSPDGTKILFQSMRSGEFRLWYMNADGSNPTCITCDFPKAAGNASWSAKDDTILFQVNGTGNGIFSVKLDGSELTQITTVADGHDTDQTPDWHPDGQKFVYMSPREAGGVFNEFYIVNADGGNEIRLTTNNLYENGAFFSPDGTKIGFTRADDIVGNPTVRDPWIINLNNGQENRLFQTGYTDWFYGWQPIPNKAPSTQKDILTTKPNIASSVNVLSNDSDEEALDAQYLTIKTQPANGTAKVVNGKVEYSPKIDFAGSDELTYQVCDSFLLDQKCSTGVLSITVQAGSKPPAPQIHKVGTVELNGAEKVYFTSNKPTFSGKAEPFATVKVEIHSDPIILATQADANGNWSITPEVDIPNGEHTVKIFTIKDGVASDPVSFVLGINVGLAETGSPLWPLTLIGFVGALGIVSGKYLKKRVAK